MTVPDAAADQPSYRAGVGAILFNRDGLVFVGRRADLPPRDADISGWQFPQGGIDGGEDPRRAVLRELAEEIGTDRVEIVGEHSEWLSYDFPSSMRLGDGKAAYRGQRQRWFALRFTGQDADIRLDCDAVPEFDAWRWVTLDSVAAMVVGWKCPVYAKLSAIFAGYAKPEG